MNVILGTAHLETTLGKRSPDGKLRECIFSREIVQMIKQQLENKGVKVFIDYESLTPNEKMKAKTQSEEQKKELSWRVNHVNELCSKYGASNCIYVSIHVNASGNGSQWMSANGWSVYVSPNASNNSKKLAKILYEQAESLGLKGNRCVPKEKYWVSNLYVCKNTKCPAVLTENMFQDNKEDVAFLLSEEGKKKLVDVHVYGILNYINSLKIN